jgi:hypothetical protein
MDRPSVPVAKNLPENEQAEKPPRIWALHCPFNKRGFPVLGNFGYTERDVIIVPVETWNKLCAEIPQLQTMRFEVGSYD